MTAPDILRDALVHTASNCWTQAHGAWLQCREQVPYLSALLLVDVSMRIGDMEQAQHFAATCEVFAPGTPYLTRLKERAATVVQRRSAFTDATDPTALNRDDLRKVARAAIECHLWQQSITLWQTYLDRFGPNVEAFKRLAACYQNLGDYSSSARYFRKANEIRPDPALGEALDRVLRLDQRKFDSFGKQVQRFLQLPAFEAAVAAAATNPPLNVDLMRVSVLTGIAPSALALEGSAKALPSKSTLLDTALPHPQPTSSQSISSPPSIREVDLDALRARVAADPAAGFTRPPLVALAAAKRPSVGSRAVTAPNAAQVRHSSGGPTPFAPRAAAQPIAPSQSVTSAAAPPSKPSLMSRLKSLASKS